MFVIYDPDDVKLFQPGSEGYIAGSNADNSALRFIQICDYMVTIHTKNRTYRINKDRYGGSKMNKDIWIGQLPHAAKRKMVRMLRARDGIDE